MSDCVKMVRALAQVVREENLAELEYETEDLKVRLVAEREADTGQPGVQRAAQASAPSGGPERAARPPGAVGPTIPSLLTGVFYRASSPKAAPFVEEGDTVAPGQTVCIIEAMKQMNEIRADWPAGIRQVLAENAKVVQAGQPLFAIELL